MFAASTKKRLAAGFASLAVAATLSSSFTDGSPAHADPKQLTAAIGVGSDTVQDVMNALAGTTNNLYYTPLASSAATGAKQVISFDAVPPSGVTDMCITTKINGPSFTRPNGSGAGRKALYAASGLSSAGWTGSSYTSSSGTVFSCSSTAIDLSGSVDFARSSSGPASGDTGTDMTYVPFGRDGVSFAYYQPNPTVGSPTVTSLTRAQLTTLFTTGAQVINGTNVVPCGIQTSSGTFAFWNKVTTATTTQENTATTQCNALLGRAEENDGTALKARGDALALTAGHANDEVIIGFSAASFIAKGNLVAPGAPPAGVVMGAISNNGSGVNLTSPVDGTAPNYTPDATFYGDATFGRDVYVVLPTTVATGPGNAPIKSLFTNVGATPAAICSRTATINTFGFLAASNCGVTTVKGSWITGAS